MILNMCVGVSTLCFISFAVILIATPAFGMEIEKDYNPFSDEFIDLINSKAKTWKAGRNFDKNTDVSIFKILNGVVKRGDHKLETITHDAVAIPDEFDSRTNWPNCPTIKEIRNQGCCGSCWAISSAEAMSDRECIHSNATRNFHYSTENIVGCTDPGENCDGGDPSDVFQTWVKQGYVSGGPYHSNQGCQPYTIRPHNGACPQTVTSTPTCEHKCEAGYPVAYDSDLHFGKTAYSIQFGNVQQIQTEILKNGPVVAEFNVYADFINYQEGVYQHTSENLVGFHAVKIIGWGTEKGTPYWLIANSWGTKFGKLGGFFKMLRGSDECGIEDTILAGLPK